MGLDTSYDCWHGSYSSFHHFRNTLAKAAGYDKDDFHPTWPAEDPLILLLDHSDCDGFIHRDLCKPIALRLRELAPHLDEAATYQARRFADGLEQAAADGEHVEFG